MSGASLYYGHILVHVYNALIFYFVALGNIGVISEEITECLLWAVRYEEKEAVRAEACHTIAVLELQTEEVAEVLQERFLVESYPIVRE